MLGFLRKYQRFFFLIITVVIVISFSFFGTSPTTPEQQVYFQDETVVELQDGTSVKRSELDAMARFLSTDSLDAWVFGGAAGFNFLNDGFVRRDILGSGIAEILVREHLDVLEPELTQRLRGEKAFVPYVHPAVKFLGVEQIWQQVAPPLYDAYTELRSLENAATPEAFATRVRLYLAESALPQPLLKRFLVQQQQQYDWIPEDPYLAQRDLALFGYHRVDEWFGQGFQQLVAQLTLRVAQEATKRGYEVTDEEVYADLMRNASLSFQQISGGAGAAADQIADAYARQLRAMNLSETQAVRIWRQVMLFRRLVEDVGFVPFVDPLLSKGFQEFATASVDVERFELPMQLRINSFRKFQELETYLGEVSADKSDTLLLPTSFKDAAQVNPHFLQKRFVVMLRETSTQDLQAGVNIRDAWKWQLEDQNWQRLQEEFPELRNSSADSDDARFAALEELDSVVRARVDRFARESIVAEHPEWIDAALEDPEANRLELRLLKEGGAAPLAGITDMPAFTRLLEQALEGSETAKAELERYRPDETHVYRIHVVDGSSDWEVMTFAEAVRNDAVAAVLDRRLERHYQRIRDDNPESYQDAQGKWKDIKQVRSKVAEDYFKKQLAQLRREEASSLKGEASVDDVAATRLLAQLRHVRERLLAGDDVSSWIEEASQDNEMNVLELSERKPLALQWSLARRNMTVRRDQGNEIDQLVGLETGDFSAPRTLGGGVSAFDKVTSDEAAEVDNSDSVQRAHQMLGREVVKSFMTELLPDLGQFQTSYLQRQQAS